MKQFQEKCQGIQERNIIIKYSFLNKSQIYGEYELSQNLWYIKMRGVKEP